MRIAVEPQLICVVLSSTHGAVGNGEEMRDDSVAWRSNTSTAMPKLCNLCVEGASTGQASDVVWRWMEIAETLKLQQQQQPNVCVCTCVYVCQACRQMKVLPCCQMGSVATLSRSRRGMPSSDPNFERKMSPISSRLQRVCSLWMPITAANLNRHEGPGTCCLVDNWVRATILRLWAVLCVECGDTAVVGSLEALP